MDHVVYLDAKAKEMEKIQRGVKTKLIRGATGRKLPYGKVNEGDILYFINDNSEGSIRAKAIVKSVYNSPEMTKEESIELVEENKDNLRLSATQTRRWAGKRFLVLIEIEAYERIEAMTIDKSGYGAMDDWLLVGDVHNVLMI